MLIQIGDIRLDVAPLVLGVVAAGVAVVLIILIICCCWFCSRRKNGNDRNSASNFRVKNPPEVKGNQTERPAQQQRHQQQQQQNNPPRMAEHRKAPNHTPPAPVRVTPPRQPPSSVPAHLQRRSDATKKGSSSIPPQSPASPFASSQIRFSYEELVIATNGFSRGNILGQGGFGFVHKGVLPTGKEIAVKSLKTDSGQGEREFHAEVDIISKVHHRHLVSLIGYCKSGTRRLLVYEFVPNKTLEFHLYEKGQPVMDWPTRVKVAIGAAKGLAYLHEDCHPRIIHRDIKAANILLDDNFEAKVADFGLAKFNSILETHVSTRVMGTLGYIAPEYASSGKLTAKSDVYSFGALLLELITGRKPFDKTQEVTDIVEWARPLLTAAVQNGNFDYLVDPQIQYCYNHTEMARMVHCAATCVRKSARQRPRISQVVRALEGNMSLADLSKGIVADLNRESIDDSASEYSETSKAYGSTTEYSSTEYRGDSRGLESAGLPTTQEQYFTTDEHDGTTSEFGLYASTSSGRDTTRELNSAEVKSVIKRSQRPI
ncbi:hypothetical protein RND81_06G158600 [Saponaria officinalis]|uniref:non-specific serine/threonine protein kinase n=1 Tax=Saponaria officinalis TaxID=3572 RepID=A0AAW1KDK5_SAPOF